MQDFDEPEEELASAVKGKKGELIVIGKLLERGYQVYTPLIDTGIDCLVDVGGGNYKEIQIKYREEQPIFTARKFKARDNFYIICYLSTRRGDDFWILPSKIFAETGSTTETKSREHIQLRIGKEGSDTYEQLIKYHDNFGVLLTGATKEVRSVVERVSRRIEEPHLKASDYNLPVLDVVAKEGRPLARKEIIDRVYERLRPNFTSADLKKLGGEEPRWHKLTDWAITKLNKKGLIESKGKNQWAIATKGREYLTKGS